MNSYKKPALETLIFTKKIIHEACEWAKKCNYDKRKAIDSTGVRGDLYFILKTYEDDFFPPLCDVA